MLHLVGNPEDHFSHDEAKISSDDTRVTQLTAVLSSVVLNIVKVFTSANKKHIKSKHKRFMYRETAFLLKFQLWKKVQKKIQREITGISGLAEQISPLLSCSSSFCCYSPEIEINITITRLWHPLILMVAAHLRSFFEKVGSFT